MKIRLFIASLVLSGAMFAQTPAPTPKPAPMQHNHAAMMAAKAPAGHDSMAHMKSLVDQMKANLAKFTDPAAKQQAQLDLDMWQAFLDMHAQMQGGMMAGMSGMSHEKMAGMAGMSHDKMGMMADKKTGEGMSCCCSGMAGGMKCGGMAGKDAGMAMGGMKCGMGKPEPKSSDVLPQPKPEQR